ncbi:MAG: MFS transporter [Bacillota bacterium]|nr:MFS transporter [Bacillota bacterium]
MKTYASIKKDPQIFKFSMYGFLKNLKFFEPYLIIYLLSFNISLFQIGILYSIREIITYIFEIPSGIIADQYGKKNELMLCFVFYIISFVLFFIGAKYSIIIIAMIFFGLGEAFRSGTHKSMILAYLERNDWFSHKAFVYGRTRSFSLLGSSLSSFVSIIFILSLPATRWIFIITIVPYILDFFLIYSYPSYLNEKKINTFNLIEFFNLLKTYIKSIFKQKFLLKIILSSSSYDALFKTIKDYIQPILLILLVTNSDTRIKVYLGIIYGVFYIFSSFASKNVFRIVNKIPSINLMNSSYFVQGIGMLSIAMTIYFKWPLLSVIIFFVLYVLKDARRPVFVDLSSDHMKKSERATVLSVESQFRSIIIIIIAPLFGYLSDALGLDFAFISFGFLTIALNVILHLRNSN